MKSRTELVEVKTTLRVSDTLLDKFKHLAIDKKTTMNNLIISSMEEYLSKLEDHEKKRSRMRNV